jgi:Ca2+-transporting ATPase
VVALPIDTDAPDTPRAPTRPWTLDAGDVAAALETDPTGGLSSNEAARRLAVVGPNELERAAQRSAWRLFASQFANTMTVVLLVAAGITAVIGETADAIVILVIVALNAVIGFVQENRAEKAMAALERLTALSCTVVRDGEVREVPAADLVPGDVVRLTVGDAVPADLRLTDVHGLRVNEATLTGESVSTVKTAEPLPDVDASLLAEQLSMAFKGTVVTYGRAEAVVTTTGMATELGRIASLLQTRPAEPTPLQRRLAGLGRVMAAAAVVVCVVVFTVGVLTGEPVETMFLTAVGLAVAAIPEGLPAVVTVALAMGARRMADRRALIRKLPAVETLGSVTVICSDKTGTLTENRMVVERVWTPAGEYVVSGSGYEPAGGLRPEPDHDPYLGALANVAVACNDAVLHPSSDESPQWTITGDPTEGALLSLAAKLGVERSDIDRNRPRHAEIAFDAARRRMTTIHRDGNGHWLATKGALSALGPLLGRDTETPAADADAAAQRLADDGYRVLALAEGHTGELAQPLDEVEHDLRLLGLVAIADPPRMEVRDAVATCRSAGMSPVMITGDNARTATSIAHRLGVLGQGEVLTGADLDTLDPGTLAKRVEHVEVFARTNPEQKLRIVNAWKERGGVVAMTGDGVNDAPALRRADIGVAMGITGTDVSKEAADMVLADDNFATIVHAVEEGRRIYDNIRRFVRYMLTTNSAELWVMFIAPLIGLPLPLLPVQILWINLVTDGLPAVTLGLEPAEPDVMDRPPRPAHESILARGLWQHAVWVGILMAGVTLPLLVLAREAGWPWQTMVFTTLAFLQLGHAIAVRSERQSVFRLGLLSNRWHALAIAASVVLQLVIVYVPAFQPAFGTEPLDPLQLVVVLAVSPTAFIAVEIEKWVTRRRGA